MERQTNLTLEQMVKELRTQGGCHSCHSDSGLPACLLANEVGVMAKSGDLVAEAFLCEMMLSNSDINMKAISYSYLKNLRAKQEGTEKAIKVFVTDPQNAPIISMVEEKEAEEQAELHDPNDRHLPGNS